VSVPLIANCSRRSGGVETSFSGDKEVRCSRSGRLCLRTVTVLPASSYAVSVAVSVTAIVGFLPIAVIVRLRIATGVIRCPAPIC
jgi:hypothetical protein